MSKKNTDIDRQITLMLGYLCVATEIESSLVRKVEILDKFELPDSDIAKICGSSVQSIRNSRQTRKRR
jgi:hypothetical protein